MKTIIAGSREGFCRADVERAMDACPWEITSVVVGGARGVDTYAREIAFLRGLTVDEHLPRWDLHGKAAGPIRNAEMVRVAGGIVALWDGKSRGTADVIQQASKAGLLKHIEVFEQ